MKKILFIGAHTDDVELGCGGTVSKMIEQGYNVTCMAFSCCYNETLKEEYVTSMKTLGVHSVGLPSYKNRTFSTVRQDILDLFHSVKHFDYDIIFTHSQNDFHQDHQVIAIETLRAFKHTTIYSYSHPWNTINPSFTCMSEITEEQLNKKIEALNCYKSQVNKTYMDNDYIKSLAITNGVIAGTKYAEAFECVRVII